MLAEQKAMVGRDDQRGVLPQVVLVEIVEQLAHQEIAQRHHGIVIGPQLLTFLGQLVDAPVARPVADGTGPVGLELVFEARRRGERLVRIKGLDLQEPVVRVTVQV